MDAIENRYVVTCDVPGAFMHSDIDEQVHLKLEGESAELLVKVDPTYAEFVSNEKGEDSYLHITQQGTLWDTSSYTIVLEESQCFPNQRSGL